jgi:hypothetical protein
MGANGKGGKMAAKVDKQAAKALSKKTGKQHTTKEARAARSLAMHRGRIININRKTVLLWKRTLIAQPMN